MKRKVKANIVLVLILSFVTVSLVSMFYAVLLSSNMSVVTFSSLMFDLGKLAGFIGFLFLALLILSGETARFFDKFFGMDRIIKFQRKFSLVAYMITLFHPIFFIISTKIVKGFIVPDFTVMPLAIGIIAFYLFTIIMIASLMYKRVSYNVWQYLHILTYVLFFFSVFHSLNLGSDVNYLFIKVIYGILMASIICGIIYRTSYKIKQRRNKFIVKEVKWETKDTFSLILEQKNKLIFKAGQFCFLRINKDKLYARHPFTISSAPDDKYLMFTIKNSGIFTKAASLLKKGEEVKIEGPCGIFTIEDSNKEIVMISGGVGITPFMSMIKDNISSKRVKKMILIYGSKTKEDIIFKEELDKINDKSFKKVYVLSNEKTPSKDYDTGYVDKDKIIKQVKNIENSVFYICGPEIMKNNVKKALKELGVNKERVIVEDFFW